MLGKNLVNDLKTSRPIRMQDFLSYNISKTRRGIKFKFCIGLDIQRSNEFILSFQVNVMMHTLPCPKSWQIVSQLHLKNELNYKFGFCLWLGINRC